MRIASFDVFDTLLTRTFASPHHVFRCVGEQLGRPGFAAARAAAERTARQRAPGGEVTLAEIYAALARTHDWSPAECDAALARELAVEAQHIQPVATLGPVVAAARSTSDQIVFISDMYLSSEVIGAWLRRAGFMKSGDRLYVSGEKRAGKGSGALFERARAELGGSFAAWTHQGDHRWSDCQRPRALGIQATLATPASLSAREQIPLREGSGFPLDTSRSLLAGTMRCLRIARPTAASRPQVFHEVGSGVAGPLFHGFVQWCLTEAAQRGIRRLYFLSRGGQVLLRVAQEISRQAGLPVECRYLYTSRLAFTGPSILREPARRRLLVAPTSRHHSVRQALANLGLDEHEARDLVPAALGDNWDRNLELAERAQLADRLLAPEHLARVQAALSARAALGRDYLAAEGVLNGEPVGLVDTGWFGSIQQSIGELAADAARPGRLTGFYLGHMEQTGRTISGEMLGYANTFNRLPLRRQTSHLVLLELLAQADHGPLAGFRREPDGRVTPVLDDPGPVNLDEIRSFQESVLEFSRRYLTTASGATPPDARWHWAALEVYKAFHRRPTVAEVLAFGRMPHADQLKEASFDHLVPALGWTEVLKALSSARFRPHCWWIEGQARLGSPLTLRGYAALKVVKWRIQTTLTGLRD